MRRSAVLNPSRGDHGHPWILGALVVQGATAFVLAIDRDSLAGDELATLAGTLTDDSLLDVVRTSAPYHNHPPLYYAFLWFWGNALGTSETLLRLPSALFMAGCVPLLYTLGRSLTGRWAAVFACQLLIFSPTALHYAHEARPYALFCLLSLTSLHLLLSILSTDGPVGRRRYAAYGVMLFAVCATHPYSVFVLLGQVAVVCLFGSGRRRAFVKTWLATMGGLAPLAVHFAANSTKMESFLRWPEHVNVPTDPRILDFLGLPFWLVFGDPSASSVIASVLAGSAFLFLARGFLRTAGGPMLGVAVYAAVLLVLPVLTVVLWANIFVGRYFIAALPIVVLLGAGALARGTVWRPGSVVLCALVLSLAIPGAVRYHKSPDRTQWREAVGYILQNAAEHDAVMLKGESRIASQTAWDYYAENARVPVWTMRRTESDHLASDDAARILRSDPPPRIWMTKSGPRRDRAIVAELEELLSDYDFVAVASFVGMDVYRGDRATDRTSRHGPPGQ